MTWRLTLGRSCPRSWRREGMPFSRFQCQGEHNGSGDGEDKEDGEDDNGDGDDSGDRENDNDDGDATEDGKVDNGDGG